LKKTPQNNKADFGEAGQIEYWIYRGETICLISDVMNLMEFKDRKISALETRVFELEDKLSRILNEEYHIHGNGD